MYTEVHSCLKWFVHAVGSDFFANTISLLGFAITIGTLIIGGRKVSEKASELLAEFNKRKRNAIFSYHENLKIYILRLKRLISTSEGTPTGTLYRLSNDEKLRSRGSGYDSLEIELKALSQKFLDYLSSKSEQVPAAKDKKEDTEWNDLKHKLANYLADFLLLGTGSYLPSLHTEDMVNKYHQNLLSVSNHIIVLLGQEREDFWKTQSEKKQ